MDTRPSQQMINAMMEIMKNRVVSTYTIDCTISNSNYQLDVDRFIGMAIDRNFANSYMDYISVSIDLHPPQLLELLNNYQDLKCTIICRPVNTTTCYHYLDRQPIIFEGRVVIDNPADLAKKYNLKQLGIGENDGTVTKEKQGVVLRLMFQMVEQANFDLRHKTVNAMFTDTSIDKVLYYVTEQLGIKKSAIAPTDNKDTPKNFIIPPGLNISNVFNYIQERYGAFGKGIRSYLSEGKLHVYPANEHSPKDYPSIWHLIKAPEGSFKGETGYHKLDGKDLHIVCSGGGDVSNLTESGVEQMGNSQVSFQADRVVDHATTIKDDGKVMVNSNVQNLTSETSLSAQKNAVNSNYAGSQVNAYNSLSNMSQYDAVIASVGWVCAEPILAPPGQKVCLHYDDEGHYITANGVLEAQSYQTQLEDVSLSKPFFTFKGALMLRLKPDKRSATS